MEQQPNAENQDNILFKHTMRPNWGLAILAYEDDDKKAFQFEDGKVRLFKNEYLQLLQAVDTPVDQSARTLARLGNQTEESTDSKATKSKGQVLPIDAQIMYFSEKYPDGFAGAAWQAKHRGVGVKRRLKRHRNPAIAEAQEFLNHDEMSRLMQAGEHAQIVARLVVTLEGCDLVSKKMASDVAVVYEERAIPLVQALFVLLHGTEQSLAVRFERWYTELQRVCHGKPSFSLATAPLALAKPEEHICVRRACFLRQAAWMAPRLASERAITGRNYQRWVEMAAQMRSVLDEAGLQVGDNLDIHDFISETMAPKSMARASELHRARQ
jgi:hypothetical protein